MEHGLGCLGLFGAKQKGLKNVFKVEVRGLTDRVDVGRIREFVKSRKIPRFGPKELDMWWCRSIKCGN